MRGDGEPPLRSQTALLELTASNESSTQALVAKRSKKGKKKRR